MTKKRNVILLVIAAIGVIILPFILLLAVASVLLFGEDEVDLDLYCSPTGDYNHDALRATFSSYRVYDKYGNYLHTVYPAGALSDKQGVFIELGKKYKVDAVLMMSIALHETGYGQSNAVVNYNNPGGLMSGKKLMKFPTLDKGIESMAKTLRNRMIKDGNKTIMELAKVYAPIGAANDPNNLNSHWVDSVTQFVAMLGGVKNCEIVGDIGGVFVDVEGDYIIPTLDGFTITSHFGYRIHPITKEKRLHTGTDLACSKASPILAFTDGIVTYVEDRSGRWSTGLGNYIIVDHGGVTTWYGHLETGTTLVRKGQTVKAGQQIAGCGTTGASTGYHLHFNVRAGKQYLDPYPYLMGSKTIQ